MRKSLMLFALLFIGFIVQQNAFAQKHADLLFRIISPSEGEVISYGDTAYLRFSVTNLGPDDIDSTNTLYINEVGGFSNRVITPNIPVGDSAIDIYLISFSNTATNDTFSNCLYLSKGLDIGVIDSNQINDTACVMFVLEGSAMGIPAIQERNTENIKLYPNPAFGLVNIPLNTVEYQQLQLRVTDVLGREVLLHDYTTKSGLRKSGIQFDVTGFSPGVYFVRLMADDKTFMSKLVVR